MTAWSSRGCRLDRGIELQVLRTGGDKPPIVLLHGLMGSGATWTPIARVLEAEYDVVMPDARGHGGSSAPDRGYRYDDLAGDVVGLIDTLELARPVVVGHSMGGMTAAVVASRISLRGVVLVDPTFLTPERQQEVWESDVAAQHRRVLEQSRDQLIAQALARNTQRSRELIELQADARLRTAMAAFDVLRPPNPPYRELVAALAVPSLLVIGDEPVVTPAMATELAGINARLRIAQIEDAGHGLPFDQPERLAAVIAGFVREL